MESKTAAQPRGLCALSFAQTFDCAPASRGAAALRTRLHSWQHRTMVRSLFVLLAIGGVASAADPTAWRLARVTSAARDGLTQFQVLHLDAHGGQVRIIRSPRDESCPGGATYVL